MPIQILSPQLANQIAAGEVVERPASVVKELVENSLDAGASHIEIDIEKGGSKLIRIRDNGSGIAEHELVLALSRHATSKISDLDDLESISSLGFRGEALASISSVSRLTLTSKTPQQTAAWQANAEGRDMQVAIRPAAHPVGTSIEVVDLFFNTPARRKFLRTDKTEFGHIDELVKRLALSRYDVSWQLNHNGQSVRRLKAVQNDEQRQKRVVALCGRVFAEHAAYIENQYGDVRLWGWVVQPEACSSPQPSQYCYVNGRMMRDKLLNHAIRQAYGDRLAPDQQPSFVLYLELDPRQVDVNVHPAKHEVRFHQARLIHDFVVSALSDALAQLQGNVSPVSVAYPTETPPIADTVVRASDVHSYPASSGSSAGRAFNGYAATRPAAAQLRDSMNYLQQTSTAPLPDVTPTTITALHLVAANRYWLQQHQADIVVVDLVPTIARCIGKQPVDAKNLLMPLRFSLDPAQTTYLTQQALAISQLGFDSLLTDNIWIVRAVPVWLRNTVLLEWIPHWLKQAPQQPADDIAVVLLSMLLNANWVSAQTLIDFFQPTLQQSVNWHAVPLQLDATLAQLAESLQ